ncbi:hypothetical protein [Streptomyces sp. CBMA123]|uniref:hypothetical protein n=1 Tax=Streptomyces sp. CBMA123 TaxID=1896313 RepID=UPI0016619D13|nr:hypothetical protein [Streptomyces sp. CBMA123]
MNAAPCSRRKAPRRPFAPGTPTTAAGVAPAALLPAPARAVPVEPVAYELRNARTGTCLHHTPGTAQVVGL